MRETYEGLTLHTEDLLLQDLIGFHALCQPSDPDSVDSLSRLASERLRNSTINLRYEAAWALLSCTISRLDEGPPHEEGAADPPAPADTDSMLLKIMPPLPDWLEYLARSPEGSRLHTYRCARRAFVLRWFPHIHPSRAALQTLQESRSGEPNAIAASTSSHIFGPYNCLPCRRMLNSLQHHREVTRPAAPSRLAAATSSAGDSEWQTRVQTANIDRAYAVRYLDDQGYLRVFVQAEEEGAMPHAVFSMVVIFQSGEVMESVIRYPEQSFGGVNFGKLGHLKAEDVVGFSLRAIVEGAT